VIAESTRKLLGNLFELKDLGPKDLKGIAEPLRAWAALRTSSAESRFEALHAGGLTALVGREEELELVLRRWSKAKTNEGQVVLLSGEAGIGKSRLTAAVLERLAGEPHTRLRYFCSPQHTDSALYPVISQMERAAGFVHDDTAQEKLDKLGAVLAQTSTSTADATLFAEMLSLPSDGRYPKLDMTPEQRRQRTLTALVSQMEALAQQNPVLMIFEDAHWTDPTSLEVLGRAIDRVHGLRVLLVVTFRPDFQPPWIGRPYVTFIALNRLGERDIVALMNSVIGNEALPANIRQAIVERTDGIPLFVEEITKAILEAGNEGAAEQSTAPVRQTSLAVPSSLQASLMARLDRLGPAKEVAQIGAVIGREFSYALLAAVARGSEQDLRSALDSLLMSGLLFQQGAPPHGSYLFKHALVRDTAYGTLLREPRRALHARIAETLESRFADIAENQPELLARHCTEAGLIEKAAGLWGKAGQQSLEHSALLEAAEQFTRAIEQIENLPATSKLRRQRIKVQVGLANALMHTKGRAAPETRASVDQARLLINKAEALGEAPEDPLTLFSVLYGLWNMSFIAFDGDSLREISTEILRVAQKQEGAVPLMVGHRLTAMSLLHSGEITSARTHFDRAAALYDPGAHLPLATRFGQDVRVATLSFRSSALWLLGYPEAALRDVSEALKDARAIGQASTLMYALTLTSLTLINCGSYAEAIALLDELATLVDHKGALHWRGIAMMSRGWVFALSSKASDAIDTIIAGTTEYRSTGATVSLPTSYSYLATAYADLGHFDDALHYAGKAMAVVETTKERWWEAEVNRMAAEIALKSPEHDLAKAEAYFERALAVSRQQQAKSWELRAAMSMARLWRGQGKRDEARDLLAPVYGWFTEGFDTLDLKEAKALLDELAG
jgi:predicted ATPase